MSRGRSRRPLLPPGHAFPQFHSVHIYDQTSYSRPGVWDFANCRRLLHRIPTRGTDVAFPRTPHVAPVFPQHVKPEPKDISIVVGHSQKKLDSTRGKEQTTAIIFTASWKSSFPIDNGAVLLEVLVG